MKFLINVIVALCSSLFHTQLGADGHEPEWNYAQQNSWPDFCLTGKRQAPIFLDRFIINKRYPKRIVLNGTTDIVEVQFKTVDLRIHGRLVSDEITVSGGPIDDIMSLDHVSFIFPAQHMVRQTRDELEIDYHFSLSGENVSVILAVLGAAVIVWQDDYGVHNIGEVLEILSSFNESSTYKIRFSDILPNDLSTFYMYPGSLSKPPCTEPITWIVFRSVLIVPLKKVNKIRHRSKSGVWKNARWPQFINGQEVYLASGVAGRYWPDISCSLVIIIIKMLIKN